MKRQRDALLALGLLLLLVFAACVPKPPTSPTTLPMPEAVIPKPASAEVVRLKPAWEEEWDRLVLAAQREGKLVRIGSIGGELRTALDESFRKKYGIRTESVAGRGGEIAAKILAERRAGLYLADVYLGGPTTQLSDLKPAGVLDPLEPVLILPEVTNPDMWFGGKLLFLDRGRTIFAFGAYPHIGAAINTSLVKPGELRSYRDLLDPKWKGKILMNDPSDTGAAGAWFQAAAFVILGVDYMRELVKQEPVILRDQRQQVDWLAKGKYPVLVAPKTEVLVEYEKAGATVTRLDMAEGTHLVVGSGCVSLINRAPHPNAAKLFINWLLTKEGLTVYSKGYGSQTARLDVPTDFLDPSMVRQTGVKYYNPISEEFYLKRVEQLKVASEIFGQFVR